MRGKISDIARMLVEAEVITQQQLDECLAAFREKRKQGGKPRLFELLVRRGYATRDQLKSAINRYDRKQTVKRLGIDYKPQLLACPRCKTSLSVRNPEPGGHLLCTQCGQQLALAQEGEALLLSESELSETPATQPQQTIGDYRVLEQLDSDGTGSRYRAGHTESGELALIKLFDDTQASPEYTEKIQQRYRDSSAIQHHGLQRPLKLGEQGGCLYVVAEWPEGQTLAQRLETTPCLPVEQVLVIAISLCEALDELHRQGVIHRDIRPTRIWVTEQRIVLGDMTTTPQVMDHIMTVAASTQTEPFYLAPEQVATGGQVDQRADVYGLGATLYHLLCGTPPVEGLSPFEVLMRLAGGALPLASEVNPEVPPQLAHIVDRMLASDPEERYPWSRLCAKY